MIYAFSLKSWTVFAHSWVIYIEVEVLPHLPQSDKKDGSRPSFFFEKVGQFFLVHG